MGVEEIKSNINILFIQRLKNKKQRSNQSVKKNYSPGNILNAQLKFYFNSSPVNASGNNEEVSGRM